MFFRAWNKANTLILALVVCGGAAFAQDFAQYQLTQKNGPWLVMAAVFADYDAHVAQSKAVELVRELRANRMDAYIFVRNTGNDNVVEGTPYWVYNEEDPESAPTVSTRYRVANPGTNVEYAVLVGNFPSLEDSRAAKMLDKIRSLQPKCMAGPNAVSHPLFGMTERNPNAGPLSRAFLVANPLIERERFVAPGLDPVVLAANKSIKKYSLLDCPGTYTVQVAVLKGITTLNQRAIADIQRYETDEVEIKGQTLAEADERAVKLCEALRAKGYDAYVFRDHYASIVTVGSFDQVGSQQNGQFVVRPEIMDIFQKFSASCDPSRGLAGIMRKTIRDIPGGRTPKGDVASVPFDVTPRVVVVPRRPALGSR